MPDLDIVFIPTILVVPKADWNGLVGTEYPFLRYEFLQAPELSRCVCIDTGWQPQHLLIKGS